MIANAYKKAEQLILTNRNKLDEVILYLPHSTLILGKSPSVGFWCWLSSKLVILINALLIGQVPFFLS